MLFKSLVKASLVGAAVAQPLQHQHHEHNEKRAVKIITQTNVVMVTIGNGQLTTTLPAVSLASPSTSVSVQSNTDAPQDVPSFTPTTLETSAVSAETETESTSEATSESESSTSSESESSSTGSSGSTSGKGITYSPYSNEGGCKSASTIKSEVAKISEYDVIRIYGVDCDQVANVLAAKSDNQKLFAGIYDVQNIQDGVDTLSSAIKTAGVSWDHIHTVSIGNELVNSGQATVSQVKQYVQTAKSALQSAGFSGPVVAVDTFIAVINNPGLCEIGDYTAVNAHAYFDGYVTADQAGDWVLEQIQRVYTACSGSKPVYITETGWPSQGNTNGVAVPSKSNQQKAVGAIKKSCGDDAILFSAFDEGWKQDGSYNVEKHFGIYST